MRLNITLRVTSSGRTVFEVSQPFVLPAEEEPVNVPREAVFYHEPLETASRVLETRLDKESTDYVVSPSTG